MTDLRSRKSQGVVKQNGIAIGLLWHAADSGNLGVGALTLANLALAREAAAQVGLKPHFTIIGFASDTGRTYVEGEDIATFAISRRTLSSPSGYWATLGRLDCILDIGGGDSFADIYEAKRFAYIWATKAMAIARRVPLLFSPQTIGPFTRPPFTMLAKAVMRRADAIVARDPVSFKAVRKMAPRARAVQSVDVAFMLPFQRPTQRESDTLYVGINVSALLYNRGFSGENEFGLEIDYAALMRRLIATLSARTDVRVHLFCHVNSDVLAAEDDGVVADQFAQEFPRTVRVPDFKSPSDAKSFISGMDFVVSGRMHACIAAFSSGVPVVPIAYSRKFTGLFEAMLGYEYLVPVTGMSTDTAYRYVLDCLDRRSTLAAAIERGNRTVSASLDRYRAELERLFTAVGAR